LKPGARAGKHAQGAAVIRSNSSASLPPWPWPCGEFPSAPAGGGRSRKVEKVTVSKVTAPEVKFGPPRKLFFSFSIFDFDFFALGVHVYSALTNLAESFKSLGIGF
jgi:hypothetical protein